MAERASDRWISIVLSVLLHGALLAAVGYGWWTYKKERPLPTLAIEATVVDARSIAGGGKQAPQEQAEREAQEKRQAEDQQRKAQEKQQEAALAVEKRAEDKRAEDK